MSEPTSIAGEGAGGTLRPLSRLGDITTGHQCWQPTIGTTASLNVFCNGYICKYFLQVPTGLCESSYSYKQAENRCYECINSLHKK